ncbi:FKBP-type peptidyl-prolyl cis-trans isomerase [Williamsia sp. MIQD14]|uniref:FKBP-type peptidyl-prolyl cis-trans isomerase n=1 Tax=Williamsia sp. MIQD14 TaxID=3425703 RepID=UPI003DA050A2
MGVLAGCGDDSSDSASASTSATATASATETADATDGAAQATTPAAAPRSGTPGSAGIPAITENATDTSKEAKIAAGTGTPSADLLIADLVAGNGKVAASGDTVNVRYTGALYANGEVFDASWKSGDAPVEFPLDQVVPGFAQGIEGMKIGGRREIVIPPALGYGASDSGPIPGGSTLVFVVDLVGIS